MTAEKLYKPATRRRISSRELRNQIVATSNELGGRLDDGGHDARDRSTVHEIHHRESLPTHQIRPARFNSHDDWQNRAGPKELICRLSGSSATSVDRRSAIEMLH